MLTTALTWKRCSNRYGAGLLTYGSNAPPRLLAARQWTNGAPLANHSDRIVQDSHLIPCDSPAARLHRPRRRHFPENRKNTLYLYSLTPESQSRPPVTPILLYPAPEINPNCCAAKGAPRRGRSFSRMHHRIPYGNTPQYRALGIGGYIIDRDAPCNGTCINLRYFP